jgi:hypothetical protein
LAQPSRFWGDEMFKSQNDESMAVLSLAIDDDVVCERQELWMKWRGFVLFCFVEVLLLCCLSTNKNVNFCFFVLFNLIVNSPNRFFSKWTEKPFLFLTKIKITRHYYRK